MSFGSLESSFLPQILSHLLQQVGDSVFLIAGKTFTYINPKGENFLGLSCHDLKGKEIERVLPQQIIQSLPMLHKGKQAKKFLMTDKLGRSLQVYMCLFLSPSGNLYLVLIQEVTSYQKVSKALEQSKQNYREIVESMEDGYYEVDLKGNFTYLNRALSDLLGFVHPEGLGINYRQFYQNPETVFEAYNKVYRTGKPDKGFAWTIINSKGEERFIEVSIALMRDGEGNPIGFSGVARDITERKKTEKRLLYLSTKDTLTNLFNRYYFEEEMKRYRELKVQEVTIFAFDIDGLKFINDTLGHEKGDQLLKGVAQILSSSFRTNDVVARIGGDEFAAIFPTYSTGLIDRINETLKGKILVHNKNHSQLPISLSVGVAGTRGEHVDLEQILRQADDEMYRRKEQNKLENKMMILDHFLYSLEEKDYMGKGHLHGVKRISLALAQSMGLSETLSNLLSLLAQYHDIGMVAVDDKILLKEGPLTLAEYGMIKRHVGIGQRIANHYPIIKELALAILYHHQWYNGGGYPGDKRGNTIPIISRIFMVADALDALIGYRPYRKPIPVKDALLLIKDRASEQFDPQVVESLFCCIDSSLLKLDRLYQNHNPSL